VDREDVRPTKHLATRFRFAKGDIPDGIAIALTERRAVVIPMGGPTEPMLRTLRHR
jgi:hypothetical protein